MKHERYLSTMITLTAALLTADLALRLADAGPLDTPAVAQSSAYRARTGPTKGVGSSATLAFEQRREMVDLLKSLNGEIKALRTELKSGAITVKATGVTTD